MGKDSKKLANVLQSLRWKIHDAQCVMTSPYDITEVCGWLSKDGTFYFSGGIMEAGNVEKALQDAGYYVVPRFEPEE